MRHAAVAAVLTTTGVALAEHAPAQATTVTTISAVSFQAAAHDTYDHATGGGAWNDGSSMYVSSEVLGADYRCGDVVTYLTKLTVANAPSKTPAPYRVRLTLDFAGDSSSSDGAALVPLISLEHLRVNAGAIEAPGVGTGTGGSDGGFVPSSLTPLATVMSMPAPTVTPDGVLYTAGASSRLEFFVDGLDAGTTTIVRTDARVQCQQDTTPTGDLSASLVDVSVVEPAPTEPILGEAQTLAFVDVASMAGLGYPVLEVSKTVSTDGTTCPGVPSRTLSAAATVRYCYTITNHGGAPAYDVSLVDDNGTPDDTFDDVGISIDGLTNEDIDASADDLAGGSTVGTAFWDKALSGGTYTNIATVTVTNPAIDPVHDSATVLVQEGVVLTKTVKAGVSSCPGTPTITIPTAAATETITFCYSVTNYSGNDALDVSLVDDGLITLTGLTDADGDMVVDDLAGNATATGSVSPSLSTAFPNETVALFWYSDGIDDLNAASSARVDFVTPSPELTVSKVQTSPDPVGLGDAITYTITAANSGDIALTAVSLTDINANLGTCPTVATLAVGASFSCTATHLITTADLTVMAVDNVATGNASGPSGELAPVDSNTVTTVIAPTPKLIVTMTQTSTKVPKTGQTVTYEVVVTNAGNVPLQNVQATLTNAVLGTCTPAAPSALQPGQSMVCVASHVVTAPEETAKKVEAKADATAQTQQGAPVVASQANAVAIPPTGAAGAALPWAVWFTLLGTLAVAAAWRRREWIWVPIDAVD